MGGGHHAMITTAIITGSIAALAHLVCGRIALGIGWQRGYMREGFLHGMLLGPIGLLTVLSLSKHYRPSERISDEYQRLSYDPTHLLFLLAAFLFTLALGTGYALLAYRILAHDPGPSWLWYAAVGVLGLAYLAFCYSGPPGRWIPVLAEWEDYADDPGFVAWNKFAFTSNRLSNRAQLQGLLGEAGGWLAGLAFAVLFIAICQPDTPAVRWIELASGLGIIAGLALAVLLRLRAKASWLEADAYDAENAAIDRRWHPAIPPEARQEHSRHLMATRRVAKEYLFLRQMLSLTAGSAICALIAGFVCFFGLMGWARLVLGPLGFAIGLALFGLRARYAPLQQPLAEEFSQLKQRIDAHRETLEVLVAEHEKERAQVELAFRHDSMAETLLRREIQIKVDDQPAGTQSAATPAQAGGGAPDERAAPIPPPGEQSRELQSIQLVNKLRKDYSTGANICFRLSVLVFIAGLRCLGGEYPQWLVALAWSGFFALLLTGGFLKAKADQQPELIEVKVAPPGPPGPSTAAITAAAAGQDGDAAAPPTAEDSDAPAPAGIASAGPDAAQPTLKWQRELQRIQLERQHARNATSANVLVFPVIALLVTNVLMRLIPNPLALDDVFGVLLAAACVAVPLGVRTWLGNAKVEAQLIDVLMDQEENELGRQVVHQRCYLRQYAVSARNKLRLLWASCLLLIAIVALWAVNASGLNPGPEKFATGWAAGFALVLLGAAAVAAFLLVQAQKGRRYWLGRLLAGMKEQQRQYYRDTAELRNRATVREVHDGYHVEYEPGELDEATIERWVGLDFKTFGRRELWEHLLDRARSTALTLFWLACIAAVAFGGGRAYAGLRELLFALCLGLLALSEAFVAARWLRLKYLQSQ